MRVGEEAGLKLGPVVAAARLLQFCVDRHDEPSRFQDLRANLAFQLPISRPSLRPGQFEKPGPGRAATNHAQTVSPVSAPVDQ